MKKFFILCLVLFLFSCKKSFVEVVAETEKSIMHVYTFDEFGSPLSTGTGFFISKKGDAISNLHVFKDAKIAFVKTYSGDIYQVDKINQLNDEYDIITFSLVNKKDSKFDFLEIDKNSIVKGQDIFIIGNPGALENTLSTGIVSSTRENNLIQITAPISPGSSGSPILTMDGKVVGVATFVKENGQNLNFGYSVNSLNELKNDVSEYADINNSNKTYLFNKVNKQKSLTLNSVELSENKTVVNFSYTNININWRIGTLWTDMNDLENAFFIQSKFGGEKYKIIESSLGGFENKTRVMLGETKKFSLVFESLPDSLTTINIINPGWNEWTYKNIVLESSHPEIFDNDSYLTKFKVQLVLNELQDKNYTMADFTINDLLENKNHDLDYLYCLKGVTSFLQEKNSDAKIYFEKAIEINPNISTYFHSLALINYMLKDDYNAIKNISSAISISPEQIEYKTFRREMYINNKQWQSALSDADYIIENSDVPNPWDYLYRGVIKSWLNINSCSDYEKGYRLALSLSKVDENYNLVLEELRKNKRYCN